MKRQDLDNLPDHIIEILQAAFDLNRQARRRILELDIQPGATNRIIYKGAIQNINESIRRLTFED